MIGPGLGHLRQSFKLSRRYVIEVGIRRGCGRIASQPTSHEEPRIVHVDEAVSVPVLGQIQCLREGVRVGVVRLGVRGRTSPLS